MRLLKTNSDPGLTIARIILGIVFLPHGAQKLLGWFGGYGFAGTMDYFTGTVGLPWLIAFLVIMIEFFGSLALIAGIGTRLVALLFTILLIGIILSTHAQFGFFMNWFGTQKGEGYEYFILALGLSSLLMISGAGKYSLDSALLTKKADR